MPETIGTAYIQIEPTTEGISGAIEKSLGGEADKAGKKVGGVLSGALGTAAKVGVAAVAGATTAVTAFGKASVDAGQIFDSSMSQVAATMGFSTDELNRSGSEASKTFQQLRNFAQEMGSSTAFSASEAADALNYMALAGYDADTSMQMLPNVLNLAAAGGIDLASASDMVTDAQSALGLSLEETGTMVDQMAMASSKSNTSVAQLGEAFLTIGANAKQLSGGTTELSTALGILADNGIKGAEGGTHLRNIMLALNPTTDKAKASWEALGVSAYDAQGNLRPLEDTFGDLNEAMEGMTDQQKSNILTDMFNKTDLASVNALLATQSTRWDELSGAIDGASGAAQNMADVQLDNLSGDITLFQSALEGAKIAVSDQLTPTLREFVQFGSEGLSQLTAAFQDGGLDGAMDALGDLLSQLVVKIVDMLPEIISAGASLLSAFGEGIMQNLPLLIETGIQIISQLAVSIGEALPELIPAIVDIVIQITETLIENVDLLIDGSIALIMGLAEGLITALPRLIEKIPDIIIKLVGAIITEAPKLLEAGVKLILALGDGIKSMQAKINEIGTDLILKVVAKIKEKFTEFKEVGKNLIEGLWNGIQDAKAWLIDKIKGFCNSALGAIKDFFGIHSPSKVLADEVGKFLPEGIAVGIDANADSALSAMDELGNGMNESLTGRLSGMNTDYASIGTVSNDDKGLYELLSMYLPIIAEGGNITLQGDADKLFSVIKNKNNVYKKSNGISAFA